MIHSPYRKVTRSLDYSTWLSQNVAKPYLLTALPSGRRERYQNLDSGIGDVTNIRLPSVTIGMEYYNIVTVPVTAFVIRTAVRYRFRGRRI